MFPPSGPGRKTGGGVLDQVHDLVGWRVPSRRFSVVCAPRGSHQHGDHGRRSKISLFSMGLYPFQKGQVIVGEPQATVRPVTERDFTEDGRVAESKAYYRPAEVGYLIVISTAGGKSALACDAPERKFRLKAKTHD